MFVFLAFAYGHEVVITTRSISLGMHGVQSVAAFTIGLIYGQSIFFKPCERRSECVVPANTLKRLVRKRKFENIFFHTKCIRR